MGRRSRLRVAVVGGLAVMAAGAVMAAPASAQDVRVIEREPPESVLGEQAERARCRDRPEPSERPGGRVERRDRLRGLQRRPGQRLPVHARASACRGSTSRSTAGPTGPSRPTRGWSARNCQGAVGDDDPPCEPNRNGPIGTLPRFDEVGLVADGDPALTFGPRPVNGRFSWANGSRLYYASLASKLPGTNSFKGAEAIAVVADGRRPGRGGRLGSGLVPAGHREPADRPPSSPTRSRSGRTTRASSPFFGNVYVCYADFRGNGNGFTNQPLMVVNSSDGGASWTQHQVTSATNNIHSRNGFGRSGCTVGPTRTASSTSSPSSSDSIPTPRRRARSRWLSRSTAESTGAGR